MPSDQRVRVIHVMNRIVLKSELLLADNCAAAVRRHTTDRAGCDASAAMDKDASGRRWGAGRPQQAVRLHIAYPLQVAYRIPLLHTLDWWPLIHLTHQ